MSFILGAILADGTSRRMQSTHSVNSKIQNSFTDKCLVNLAGKPLIEHIVQRALPQVHQLVINSRSTNPHIKSYDHPIVPDIFFDEPLHDSNNKRDQIGPLAGIASVMQWALNINGSCDTDNSYRTNLSEKKSLYDEVPQWLATFPCDAPFFPLDMVEKLSAAAMKKNKHIVCGASYGRASPLCAVWSMALLPELIDFLQRGNRKVMQFVEERDYEVVEFDNTASDPFFNINTPEQLQDAEVILEKMKKQ